MNFICFSCWKSRSHSSLAVLSDRKEHLCDPSSQRPYNKNDWKKPHHWHYVTELGCGLQNCNCRRFLHKTEVCRCLLLYPHCCPGGCQVSPWGSFGSGCHRAMGLCPETKANCVRKWQSRHPCLALNVEARHHLILICFTFNCFTFNCFTNHWKILVYSILSFFFLSFYPHPLAGGQAE